MNSVFVSLILLLNCMQPACDLGWGEREAVELLTKWFTSWLAL